MAILALPLVTSILKPHKTHFSFLLTTTKPLPIIFHRRFLSKSSTVSALSTSSSSTSSVSHNTEHQKKPSVPTFQQAIQRLQVFFYLMGLCNCVTISLLEQNIHWITNVEKLHSFFLDIVYLLQIFWSYLISRLYQLTILKSYP